MTQSRAASAARQSNGPPAENCRPEFSRSNSMYPDLQKELATFERRTPKSAEAHKKNLKRIPLGVASNYRAYDPWPIFVKEASGSKFRDLDGNEYIDHNLTLRRADGRTLPSRGDEGGREAPFHRHDVWHAARHGMGTGGRNLQPFSGRDVPLRQQRNGSDHARDSSGARRDRARQDREVRRRLPRTAR